MDKLMEKVGLINIPPHQLAKLGLSRDWQSKVSQEFVAKAINIGVKHKAVLKELAKY